MATLLKNNILPQVHSAFCNEAGCLESYKTQQIIFFKRTLKNIPSIKILRIKENSMIKKSFEIKF